MSTSPTQHHYPGPDKCIVYWDYENIAIPRGCALRTVIGVLKERIWAKVGPKQIPIHFKLYIRATKLNAQLSEEMDINGVEHINISSKKPESVDKRMLIDIALQLYELEKCKKSNAIALISGDKDFGHLLSRIHKEQPISHSLLILLNKDQSVNPNLSNNVDFVINDFQHQTFTICPSNNCQYQHINCPYYHPTNNYYPMPTFHNYNVHNKHKNNKTNHKKYRKKRKLHKFHRNKRRRIGTQTIINNNHTNTNNAECHDRDSSIEIIEKFANIKTTKRRSRGKILKEEGNEKFVKEEGNEQLDEDFKMLNQFIDNLDIGATEKEKEKKKKKNKTKPSTQNKKRKRSRSSVFSGHENTLDEILKKKRKINSK